MLRYSLLASAIVLLSCPCALAEAADRSSYDQWVDDLWALEEVYWQNRSWPDSNPGPKPTLGQVIDRSVIDARAQRTLRILGKLDERWNLAVDADRLQIELDRLAGATRAPDTLRQLFAALDHDELRLARALALPTYANRIADQLHLQVELRLDGAMEHPFGTHSDPDRAIPHPILQDWMSIRLPAIGGIESGEFGRSLDGGGCTDDTWNNLVTEPSARSLHTAVWTGSEMIVWGGSNGNEIYNSGARYNPATDTWTSMSNVGAPEGHERHSAVWTGTEMIVWGGGTTSQFESNTGGRYDPVTDSWTATTTAGAPDGRYGHVAVWTGTEMIVWGGEVYGGGRYNPSTESWTALPQFAGPDPRLNPVAVWTGSEMLIQGGGYEEAFDLFEIYKDLWRYSPLSNSWTAAPAMPGDRRSSHAGVWTGSELFVWGGYGLAYDPEAEEYFPVELDDGWRFNPATGIWSAMSSNGALPFGRYGHKAVWTGTEILVYGGYGGGFGGGAYNVAGNSWIPVPNNGQASDLIEFTAVWTGSEMITWGGFGDVGQQSKGSRYDPGPRTWVPTFSSNAPPPREEHTAVWTGAEMIVHGGRGVNELLTYRYDPALNTWAEAALAGLTQRLLYHTAVWSGTEMIVWGGIMGPSTVMDDGGRYNPTTDSWTPADQTNAPTPRYRQLAGWTGTEMIVVGGVPADGTGGRYNPATDSWTPTTLVNAPAIGQTTSGVVADGEFIVWGGYPTNDGYRYDWNADSWSPTSTLGAPQARGTHTAVWTGTEMIVWGGSSAGTPILNDGGVYDPSTDSWLPTSLLNAPPPRYGQVAVWTGDEMLVWGGKAGIFYPNTGGRYDPATDSWTSMSLEQAPSGRLEHSAVWSGGEMLVFGGTTLNRAPLGGRYCAAASCTVSDWYRDIDDDGFGDINDVVAACTAPVGYVGSGGDCDDTNLNAWATPSETLGMVLSHDQLSGTTTIDWGAPAAAGASALTYDLLRSAGADDFSGAGVCFESDDVDLTATDGTMPAAGTIFFYLSRATNACPQGDGGLGSDSGSVPRTGVSCP